MIAKHVTTICDHCGLPVPPGLLEPARKEQFCCSGCSSAWQLIHANGLDAFYSMVDSAGEDQTLRDRPGIDRFQKFDDPAFLSKFAIPISSTSESELLEITLALEGIHCAACVWLVEKLPEIVPGVTLAQISWAQGTVRLRWMPESVSLSRVAEALFRLGYTPQPLRVNEKAIRRRNENRRHLARIGIAGAAAGNNMLIAAALYLGLISHIDAGYVSLLRWASCLVGLASLLGPGRIFLLGAFNAIRLRTPHMDLPIALGLTVGSTAGLINTIRGTGEIYFDSLSVLIFLLLVGRWIQFRQQNRAADAVELLYRMTPPRARKQIDGEWVEVVVDEISEGDLLEIRPGDLIAADAIVMEGGSSIDESILTGESKPTTKSVGDCLSAGTQNLLSPLVARVNAVGRDTRIGQIVELVERASSQRPRIVEWADQVGGYFVMTVMVLAGLTFALWFPQDAEAAVDHSVALLIVACPCALALATPLAISVALGRLARRRIMVKSGDVIQSLNRSGMIWLDKTGTLTEGCLRVVEWQGERQWIPLVAAVESNFSHPVANAFAALAKQEQPAIDVAIEPTITQIESREGGVAALIDGYEILIGNGAILRNADIHLSDHRLKQESAVLQKSCSPCWIAVDGTIVALASLGDRIRPEARSFVKMLNRSGWTVGILSGDHPEVVAAVASELGIEHHRSGVTPEQKVTAVRNSQADFPTTVMVGDGVNDSAALAAATVGIAVHLGAEASLAAAPVYLADSGLSAIGELMRASQSTGRIIRWNFGASLGYNLLGASLAMAGLIHPLVAAVLMPISSLTVIAISLRAGRANEF